MQATKRDKRGKARCLPSGNRHGEANDVLNGAIINEKQSISFRHVNFQKLPHVHVAVKREKTLKYITRIALLSILVLSTQVMAQSRTSTTNDNAWLMYFGNHQWSSRWGIHAEVQWRRHNFLSDDQQLLLRTGADYHLKNGSRITVGYAFIKTYPYGEFAVANAFPEHRLWQQFLTAQTLGKVKLTHRYRLEQRFIGNANTGQLSNGRYENRMRYMAKVVRNITANEHPLFVALYNEILINFGKEVGYNIFDQNRLYGALGFTISPQLKLEIGYLYQVVQQRSLDLITSVPRNKIEHNHTFQLGFYSTMPLYKSGQ